MRVLKWIVERVEGQVAGTENIFGITPKFSDLSWNGLEFTQEQFNTITSIDKDAWLAELKLHSELFEKLAYHLPSELNTVKTQLEKRLSA